MAAGLAARSRSADRTRQEACRSRRWQRDSSMIRFDHGTTTRVAALLGCQPGGAHTADAGLFVTPAGSFSESQPYDSRPGQQLLVGGTQPHPTGEPGNQAHAIAVKPFAEIV